MGLEQDLVIVLKLDSWSKVDCIKFVGSRWPKKSLVWLGVAVESVGGLVGWAIIRDYWTTTLRTAWLVGFVGSYHHNRAFIKLTRELCSKRGTEDADR
jgi:hypothetical protein